MIEKQYCQPAPSRFKATPSHLKPQGRDVKAAAFHDHRRAGGISRGQQTVMGVLWKLNLPLTRKQIVANCPPDNRLQLSSVCGRVNELIDKGLVDCNETAFDPDTRKHVQALVLSEAGINTYTSLLSDDGDSELDLPTPAPAKPKGASNTYAKRAAILCADYDFCCYLFERERALIEKLSRSNDYEEATIFTSRPTSKTVRKGRNIVDEFDEANAATWIRTHCLIRSRSQLDTNLDAQEYFEELVWDFATWVSRRGRPAPVLKLMGAQ